MSLTLSKRVNLVTLKLFYISGCGFLNIKCTSPHMECLKLRLYISSVYVAFNILFCLLFLQIIFLYQVKLYIDHVIYYMPILYWLQKEKNSLIKLSSSIFVFHSRFAATWKRIWLHSCIYIRLSDISTAIGNLKKKMRGKAVSGKSIFVLCLASFLAGSLFTSRTWTTTSHIKNHQPNHGITIGNYNKLGEVAPHDFDHKRVSFSSN